MLKPLRGAQLNLTHPLAHMLVGYWLFNEGTGDKVFDYSRNGNLGTLTSMDPATDWVGGFYGWVPDFDGINDKVDFGNDPSLLGGWTKVSIGILFFTRTLVSAADFILQGSGGTVNNLNFKMRFGSGNNNIQWIFNGGANVQTGANTVSQDTWHRMVFVFDGSLTGNLNRAKIYIDGISKVVTSGGTIPTSLPNADYNLTIGGPPSTSIHDGKLDNFMIAAEAFSAAEVLQLYLNPYAMFEVPVSPAIFGIDVGRIQDLIGMGIIPFIR